MTNKLRKSWSTYFM